MEAKDIRKQPVTNEIFSREDLDNAFKAGERRGYDQGVEDRLREIDALTARVKTAKQIGRKEVVAWVDEQRIAYMAECGTNFNFTNTEWQAQLKKWGLLE